MNIGSSLLAFLALVPTVALGCATHQAPVETPRPTPPPKAEVCPVPSPAPVAPKIDASVTATPPDALWLRASNDFTKGGAFHGDVVFRHFLSGAVVFVMKLNVAQKPGASPTNVLLDFVKTIQDGNMKSAPVTETPIRSEYELRFLVKDVPQVARIVVKRSNRPEFFLAAIGTWDADLTQTTLDDFEEIVKSARIDVVGTAI